MVFKRLRKETEETHKALEARLPLLDATLTLEAYQGIVQRFHGFYVPLEKILLNAAVLKRINFDYRLRLKTPLLEKDLLALTEATGEKSVPLHCLNLPVLETVSQLLGCLYVIEGATLGGQIISKHLLRNLGLTSDAGAAFFNGYGTQTASLWKDFIELTTSHTRSEGGENEIVHSANLTFASLQQWLFPDGPAPALKV